ncbi:hypothetical protein CKF54_07995 [Psittacicella hinzii]|uniref:Integrase catalytic domain-containing protein n=1 Tax=Psittacicella hinzii TaxID=2028575 RepID=A0A3A1XYJ2_9GAMM|nr:hypothetical protein CKF54_07995 [Psittacicella hinzii]
MYLSWELLGLSKSTYFYNKGRIARGLVDKYAEVRKKIRKLFFDNFSTYGYRRIYQELKQEAENNAGCPCCGKDMVRQLMREENLTARMQQVKDSKRNYVPSPTSYAPNLVAGDFTSKSLGTHCSIDFTEVQTINGKVYLAVLVDYFNNHVTVSHGSNATTELAIECIKKYDRFLKKGAIIHSDRGAQFKSHEYIKYTDEIGVVRSMSKPYTPTDNAIVESVIGAIKVELNVNSYLFKSKEELIYDLEHFIHWFNNNRINLKKQKTHLNDIIENIM